MGLTPRRYARVLRFNRALEWVSLPQAPALAEIALSTRHADQAHFAYEFRRLAGLPPSQYRPVSPAELRHLPVRKNLQDRSAARP